MAHLTLQGETQCVPSKNRTLRLNVSSWRTEKSAWPSSTMRLSAAVMSPTQSASLTSFATSVVRRLGLEFSHAVRGSAAFGEELKLVVNWLAGFTQVFSKLVGHFFVAGGVKSKRLVGHFDSPVSGRTGRMAKGGAESMRASGGH